MDEGYIKFNCLLEYKDLILNAQECSQAIGIRDKVYNLGFIGYQDDIGYGNLSYRESDSGLIVITGSKTGKFKELLPEHFTRILSYSLSENTCHCEGRVEASSESLSHAVFYEDPIINAVIHIHNRAFWEYYLHKLPTSNASYLFGTVELAFDLKKLIPGNIRNTVGVVVMGGHKDGIIAFGKDLNGVYERLIELYQLIPHVEGK